MRDRRGAITKTALFKRINFCDISLSIIFDIVVHF